MTEPLVNDWALQGFEVTVAALPHIAPVYKAMIGTTRVLEWGFKRKKIELSKRIQLARQLRGQFDVCVVCPNSFKSAVIPWLARIPKRLGYLGEMRRGLLTKHLDNPSPNHRGSMVEFYKDLGPTNYWAQTAHPEEANKSGALRIRDTPRLIVSESVIDDTLLLFSLPMNTYTVLAPGAEYGPAKRWPIEYFASLAASVCADGVSVVILGSEADRAVGEEIKNTATEKCMSPTVQILNLAGKTDLTQAMGLIAGAKNLVSNDSGLMHIGAALGVAQVAVFGSSSPLHTPPLSSKAKVLWLSLECAPCFKRECPLGHTRCLRDISAQMVEDALKASTIL
jgi:heptosyltransferase-2